MPPGTGDVPLTVFQSLPLDGIVIVSSPQELVSMIVEKAVNMASLMNIDVLGLVENYSYIVCADCGKVIRPYGESKIEDLADAHGTRVLAKLPIDPELASVSDKGVVELFEGDYLESCADYIEKTLGN
jgi:Mrp family chromosome partitioning ATPase